jgi:hypothetical protein
MDAPDFSRVLAHCAEKSIEVLEESSLQRELMLPPIKRLGRSDPGGKDELPRRFTPRSQSGLWAD